MAKLYKQLYLFKTILFFLPLFTCTEQIPEAPIFLRDPVDIYPEYRDMIIPDTIAPFNFVIRNGEDAKYLTRIYGEKGGEILVSGQTVRIPLKKWKHLLTLNKGKEIRIEVYRKKKGNWGKFPTLINRVADEQISR